MTVSDKYELTSEDLRRIMQGHLASLIESADRFDQGDVNSIDRLVIAISHLIGDRYSKGGTASHNFVSVLTRLGEKPVLMREIALRLEMDSSWHGPYLTLGLLPLGSTEFVALLDGVENSPQTYFDETTDFNTWWNKPVLRDGEGRTFSRRYIIENMRDKEIVHTDFQTPLDYGLLVYRNSLNIKAAVMDVHLLGRNIANLVVRQVAHELIRTLNADFPKRYSIPSGGAAYPHVFIRISYINEYAEERIAHDYRGYKFQSLWTDSNALAIEWMEKNPVKEDYDSPPIIFYGEKKQTRYKPSNFQMILVNNLPLGLTCESHFSTDQHGTFSTLSVIKKN